MSTITKERAELKAFITGFLSDPAHDNQSSRSLTAEVFRTALASLEAEAVLPAPVSVPDEVLKMLLPDAEKAEFWFEHDGKILFEGVKFNNAVFEACRAAMLQGAEPVTTAYKLPFDQWLSQQTGTIDVECGCVMTEVFFHWLRVAYEAGNSPHCREILNSSTKNFRENAETSTKCWCRTCRPVTFADSHFVVCPECGNKRCPHANDHRNACTGSNEPGQEGSAYPAAPQQEVKPAIEMGMNRYGDAMQKLADGGD